MTLSRMSFLGAVLVFALTSAAQPIDMKKLRKIAEEEGWGKPKITVMDPAQVAAQLEAKRQSNLAEYETSFKEWREAVAKALPRTYRMAMSKRNEANVKCPSPTSELCYGALNLYEMFARFQAVKIYTDFTNETPTQADPARKTDFYLPDYQMAVLNKDYLFSEPKQRQGILIHVFLGASGYDDENYSLKVALEMLEMSLERNPLAKNVNVKALFPQTEGELYRKTRYVAVPQPKVGEKDQVLIAGGFTGHNGGGNSQSGWVKSQLLLFSSMISSYAVEKNWPCQVAWSTPTAYIVDVQALQIEERATLASAYGFERRAIGSYYIPGFNIYSGGTDIFEMPGLARSAVIGIMEDMCFAKYANGAKPR